MRVKETGGKEYLRRGFVEDPCSMNQQVLPLLDTSTKQLSGTQAITGNNILNYSASYNEDK